MQLKPEKNAFKNNDFCELDVFGYVRGSFLKPNQDALIPGIGYVKVNEVELLNDPVPLHARDKKRSLFEKEQHIYAPMFDSVESLNLIKLNQVSSTSQMTLKANEVQAGKEIDMDEKIKIFDQDDGGIVSHTNPDFESDSSMSDFDMPEDFNENQSNYFRSLNFISDRKFISTLLIY